MDEFVVYVMRSEVSGKRYVGYTGNLIARIRSHNQLSSKGWTINHRPWYVIYVEFFTSKQRAMTRERYFKTGVGREYLDEMDYNNG
ncbi:MAG: GIY-YIG nuclease family protein [Bacteroidia bacterium]|nr:GIY-YIG nuclease family protein [Bacteroidia bacterium]